MYISQQHWQQPQQQQPLDACFRTVTAYPSNSNESSDSSGNSSDSCSNSLSRTSSNNTSFSSDDDDNYTQQRQEEEDKENLWVVDGIRFTCIDSNSRVRSAVESSTATSRGNGRRSPLSFPPYSSLTPFASTPTASALSPSPPPSPTTPTRPPFIRIESQELLPTRRPGLWFRRSSSSNSLSSLASRRGNTSRRDQQQHQQKQHQQGQQQQQHQQRQNVVPAKPLKSILKKGRPVTPTLTGLHLTHAHLGPVLQHQYQLQLLNQQQQQQQQASSHSQDQLSLRRASSALHQLKRASSIITTSPPVVPPSRPRPLSSPSILNSLSTTSHPPSFPRSLPLPPRPLPTPPATKTVRWASHNEVLIIENIEDLVEMGYFDDYDTEMGWDYRDESLDDDFSVTMDSEEEDDLGSDFDPMGENDERDEELESPSEDGRFEYMYRRSADERDTYFDDDKGKGEGEEEVESSVAEDELIHRMASDQFLGGGNGAMWSSNHHVASDQFLGGGNGAMWSSNHHVASDQVLGGGNGAMRSSNHRVASDQVLGGDNGAKWPSLLYPPLSLSSKTGRSMCASPPPLPMAPPSSPLSSCFWSPPSQEQYEGVSGIIQRFQSLENQNQNNGFTRGSTSGGRSSGMISPPASPSSPQPPPRQSSLTGQSIVINKNDSGRGLSPTSSMSYLPSPSSSASTSPKLEPAVPLLMAPSALRAKCRPPRLDRAQILVEVAERKRNGVGAFASSTASASRYGVDRPLSMVASASNLLRCTRGSNQPIPHRLVLKTLHSSSITNATKTKTPKHVPLTGLFAVNKPSGITSTTILDHLQHVCKRNQSHPLVKGVLEVDGSKRAQKRGLVKIGHGGTLDPLARGIVVVGMGTGCKKLHNMSGSSKVYIAEARLGYSSTTLDSTGSLLDQKPTDHITKKRLLDALQAFKGEISQTPPLYSALNMDGKRLYDYAREGIPLPREIPSRKVQIHGLDLLSYPDEVTIPDPCLQAFGFQLDTDSSDASESDSSVVNSCGNVTLSGDEVDKSTAGSNDDIKDDIQEEQKTFRPKKFSDPILTDPTHIPIPPPTIGDKSLYFHIRVHCSSGTYIRTLIADIASHLGTVGLMTDLLRVEQSGYRLGGPATLEMRDCEDLEKVEDAIQAGNRIWDERTRQHQE